MKTKEKCLHYFNQFDWTDILELEKLIIVEDWESVLSQTTYIYSLLKEIEIILKEEGLHKGGVK